jgi:lipid-binding SYLF domain-containing protein
MKKWYVLVGVLLLPLFLCTQASAVSDNSGPARLQESLQILNRTISTQKNFLPASILQKAAGIVIIPHLLKAGFLMGVRHGTGVLVVKDPTGRWSNPVFITISGGSLGLQAGIQSSEVVMIFGKSKALESKKKTNFLLGADVSLVVGILGLQMDENTDAGLQAEIYSYSRAVGINVGFALQGASMRIDDAATAALYGRNFNSKDILSGKIDPVPAEVIRFRDSLNTLTAKTP